MTKITEKALSVEAEGLQWSSDGSNFTVVPANTAGIYEFDPKQARGISGSFSNVNEANISYGGGEIMTGNATDGKGFTFQLYSSCLLGQLV